MVEQPGSGPADRAPATLPYHYNAVLHFASAPANGQSLAQYADVFLRAYAARCGCTIEPQAHAQNVTNVSTFGASTFHSPVSASNTALAAMPEAVATVARGLQSALAQVLDQSYPLVGGETIQRQQVSLLSAPFLGCPAGTVVYTRTTSVITIDFILSRIHFNAATGAVGVDPTEKKPPASVAAPPARVLDTSATTLGIVSAVAMNLAFTLPPPWGPVGAAAVVGFSALFGSVFGDASDEGDDVGALLQDTVTALEGFITTLKLQSVDNDVSAFLAWCATQLPSSSAPPSSEGGWTDAVVTNVVNNILPKIDDTQSFGHTTLTNDLRQISAEMYVQSTAPVARGDDAALSTLIVNVTALLAAYKLSILLYSQLASVRAPDPTTGVCATNQADSDFQEYTLMWTQAVSLLNQFIYGTPPSPPDPDETTAATYTLGVIAATITAEYPRNGNSAALTYIQGDFGSGVAAPWSSIADYADLYGWAGAIDRLVLHRQVVRLLQISPVTYYDTRGIQCEGYADGGGCQPTGSDGYQFTDAGDSASSYSHDTHRWTSGCCSQNDHATSYETDVQQHWVAHFQAVVTALQGTSTDGSPSYGGDGATTRQWRTGATDAAALLPPSAPLNTVVIADGGWSASPPAGSQWQNAVSVQYAVSFVGSKGPSLRSVWSSPDTVGGQWKPTLRHIPVDPTSTLARQVWRQFIFNDANGDPTTMGLPKIVATLNATDTNYVDVDPAPT